MAGIFDLFGIESPETAAAAQAMAEQIRQRRQAQLGAAGAEAQMGVQAPVMDYAQKLMGAPAPQGATGGAGFMAASPLSFAGTSINRGTGRRLFSQTLGRMQDLIGQGAGLSQTLGKQAEQDQTMLEKGLEAYGKTGEGKRQLEALKIQQKGAFDIEREKLKGENAYARALLMYGPGGWKQYQLDAKANDAVRKTLDPNLASNGNLKDYSKRVAILGDLQRLLQANPDPDARTMREIARGFDAAISMGGRATVSGTEHLVPHTLMGDVNKIAEYLTNQRRALGQQGFAQAYGHMIDQQKTYWEDQVNVEVNKHVGSLTPHFQKFPDTTALTLEDMGFDPKKIKGHPFYEAPAPAPEPARYDTRVFPRAARRSGGRHPRPARQNERADP